MGNTTLLVTGQAAPLQTFWEVLGNKALGALRHRHTGQRDKSQPSTAQLAVGTEPAMRVPAGTSGFAPRSPHNASS